MKEDSELEEILMDVSMDTQHLQWIMKELLLCVVVSWAADDVTDRPSATNPRTSRIQPTASINNRFRTA